MAFVVRQSAAVLRQTSFCQSRFLVPLCARLPLSRNLPSKSSTRFLATQTPPQISPETPPQNERHISTLPNNDTLRLLWDSECPLCVKEVNWLRRRASERGASIEFVDIAEIDYNPQQTPNVRIEYEQAMGKIHAVRGDGTVLIGIEAFREVYDRIGMGFVYAFTKVPLLGAVAEYAYNFWADRRLSWTGRPTIQEILREREKRTCR